MSRQESQLGGLWSPKKEWKMKKLLILSVLALTSADLSAREEQVLSHVSVGSTNKEIARKLNISEKTVKYYMTNILQKLQVRNRVEAVVAARGRTEKSA